jgi:hypothetical protein
LPVEAWVWDEPAQLLGLTERDLPAPVEDVRTRAQVDAVKRWAWSGDERKAWAARLKIDADARRQLAERHGVRIYEGPRPRADRAPCPNCGRASVAWYIEPGAAGGAWCAHRGSCGWSGWLDQWAAAMGEGR